MLFFINMVIALPEEISDKDIPQELKSNELTFVRFYAPWCAYTQISEPVWNKLSIVYNAEHNTSIRFVNINCNAIDGNECRDKYNIRGYPTYRLYRGGRELDTFRATYPRKLDMFTEWLNRVLNSTRE